VIQGDVYDRGSASASLALNVLAGVLYARETHGSGIFAFDASDLTRRPELDLDSGKDGGGALEIDTHRRLLFSQEPDHTLRAWSIDHGDSYGTVLAEAEFLLGRANTGQNQMVRDPAGQRLFEVPNGDGPERIRMHDLAGRSFRAFSWGQAKALPILVGAPGAGAAGQRAAYLLLSPPGHGLSLSTARARWSSDSEGVHLGIALAAPGDVDGDGRPDLWIGAPGDDGGGPNSGAAMLVSAGDLDSDGQPDLIVGAPEHSGEAELAGAVTLIFGSGL
jgi:hypothetical protein